MRVLKSNICVVHLSCACLVHESSRGQKGKTMCLKRFFLVRSQKRHMGIDTDKQTTEELHQATIDHERCRRPFVKPLRMTWSLLFC